MCISDNNGASWGPWHTFENEAGYSYSTAAFTSNSIILCSYVDDFEGFYRTLNLGQTWLLPPTTRLSLRIRDTKNDTVFCSIQPAATIWTGDQGATFSPPRAIDLGTYNVKDLSVSDTTLHLMSIMRLTPGQPVNAAYTRAPLLAGNYEPLREINPDVFCTYNADMEFADDGVGVLASVVLFDFPIPGYGRLFINVTRDNGVTWSPPDTINEYDAVGALQILVRHIGTLWMVVYTDTTASPGFADEGIYTLFSANHARSWYPPQQIEGDFLDGGRLAEADLQSDFARVYGFYEEWDGEEGNFSFQWEGLISADSIAPELSNPEQQPLTVSHDTTLHFSANGADNDSLWLMQVVLWEEGSLDSIVLNLARIDVSEFESTWQVPAVSTTWHYYYRAEDMWENVTRLPEIDDWTFVAEGTSKVDERFEIAKEFDLSVFPNPFNSTLSISLETPIHQEISLTLYDLLGREVDVVYRGRLTTNTLSYSPRAALASGVYFLRAATTTHSQIQKITLLK